MKEIIIIVLILLIIFAGDVIIQNYLEDTSANIYSKLEVLKVKALEAKTEEDKYKVKTSYEEMEKEWESIKEMWSILIVHMELDHIEEALTKVKSNIYDGDVENSLEEIETAMFFVKHVRERERILLKNIF